MDRVDSSSEQIVDELLVMDCQAGRAEALNLLISRWQKRLWQHAHQLVRDTEAAWDVTQQSWIGIIKGLPKLDDPANFRAWAYRITTNKAIDWIKKSKKAKHVGLDEVQDKQHEDKKDSDIKELLEKLDLEKRTVLSLYYFEQLSISDISMALNIPKGTVKSRLHNARNELKNLWQQHFEQSQEI
jgi:RNA polymerase sigma-70 factor (ECF subfamily)